MRDSDDCGVHMINGDAELIEVQRAMVRLRRLTCNTGQLSKWGDVFLVMMQNIDALFFSRPKTAIADCDMLNFYVTDTSHRDDAFPLRQALLLIYPVHGYFLSK